MTNFWFYLSPSSHEKDVYTTSVMSVLHLPKCNWPICRSVVDPFVGSWKRRVRRLKGSSDRRASERARHTWSDGWHLQTFLDRFLTRIFSLSAPASPSQTRDFSFFNIPKFFYIHASSFSPILCLYFEFSLTISEAGFEPKTFARFG